MKLILLIFPNRENIYLTKRLELLVAYPHVNPCLLAVFTNKKNYRLKEVI